MGDRNFGSKEGGGFNESSKDYKRDPSIENYLRLRRELPNSEIEVSILGGMEMLFYLKPIAERHGIDINLLAGVLDADHSSISEISLQLMEKLVEARRKSRSGETQLVRRGEAIPDKLVDLIIGISLDALSWNDDLCIPRDLIVLIRERLGGSNPEYKQASEARENRGRAAIIGGQLKARGVRPTLKIIAQALGVAPSTVKRWFKPGEFETEVQKWSQMFDKDGNMLLIGRPPTVAPKE